MREIVEAIVAGNYRAAGVSPPVLRGEERERLAYGLRDAVLGKPDPWLWAWRLDLKVSADDLPRNHVVVGPRGIVYPARLNRRVAGLLVTYGVAVELLRRHGSGTNGDAWLLAVELLAPARMVHRRGAVAVALWSTHCPGWAAEAQTAPPESF